MWPSPLTASARDGTSALLNIAQQCHQTSAVGHAELSICGGQMMFDGTWAQTELLGDDLGLHSLGGGQHHVVLSGREVAKVEFADRARRLDASLHCPCFHPGHAGKNT